MPVPGHFDLGRQDLKFSEVVVSYDSCNISFDVPLPAPHFRLREPASQ